MSDRPHNDPQAAFAELQQQLKQQRERTATSPKHQPNPPRFATLCTEYVARDTWTISEAALLLHACHPERPVPLSGGPPELDKAIRATQQFLISCLGVSLPAIGPIPRLLKANARISVADLYSLMKQKSLTVPEPLAKAFAAQLDTPVNDTPHGNATRNETIREAARNMADHFVASQAAKFVKSTGVVDRKALATHMEAYPGSWVPESMFDPEAESPLSFRTLRELLGRHFREQGK
ncbi:hypothetical protein V5738_10195 [Salinisphaera sp. SPP-AMP-43]|uniref:hypothetical protein n=1 Tax=Salinisphaera sp. SPP-AMP-43 TaxID=3121288 RepID=UPI003C6DCEE1